jgi:hypothetical protein
MWLFACPKEAIPIRCKTFSTAQNECFQVDWIDNDRPVLQVCRKLSLDESSAIARWKNMHYVVLSATDKAIARPLPTKGKKLK